MGPFKIQHMYCFGASVLAQSFNTLRAEAGIDVYQNMLAVCGHEGAVVSGTYANPGDGGADYVNKLPAYQAEVADLSGVLTVVHGPGNDVTASGPYPGGAAAMQTNMATVLSGIKAAGSAVLYGPISYRIPPASNPAEPYNTEVVPALVAEYSLPPQMYNLNALFRENQEYINIDGYHPDPQLEHYIKSHIVRAAVLAANDQKVTPAADYVGERVVIALSEKMAMIGGIMPAFVDAVFPAADTTNASVTAPCLVAVSGRRFFGPMIESRNIGSINLEGRGNLGDTSDSLTNHELLMSSVLINAETAAIGESWIAIRNLPDGLRGTVTLTGSRATTATNRVGVITLQGQSKKLDAAALVPEQVSFPFEVTNGEIKIYIALDADTASIYAYVSGIQIEFDSAPGVMSLKNGDLLRADRTPLYLAPNGGVTTTPNGGAIDVIKAVKP